MRKFILSLLERLPYRTAFGVSLVSVLKALCYYYINKKKCLCGGIITTKWGSYSEDCIWWEVSCEDCGQVFDED